MTEYQPGDVFTLAPPEPFKVTVTWHNDNPDTIWNKLARKLGREPTNAEATEEVKRILRDA
jgi:hypothetical protein